VNGEAIAQSHRDLHPADPAVDAYFHDERLRVAVARAVDFRSRPRTRGRRSFTARSSPARWRG